MNELIQLRQAQATIKQEQVKERVEKAKASRERFSELKQTVKTNIYYFLVGLLSFVSLFSLPFLGSELDIHFNIPNTVSGWIIYAVTRLLGSVINMLIFHSFIKQGKVNSIYHPNYIKAVEILFNPTQKQAKKELSPEEYFNKVYAVKGVLVTLLSAVALIGLGDAIYNFSWVVFCTYIFTIALGVVFGVFEMLTTEDYWCNRYLVYAYQEQHNREEIAKQELLQKELEQKELKQQAAEQELFNQTLDQMQGADEKKEQSELPIQEIVIENEINKKEEKAENEHNEQQTLGDMVETVQQDEQDRKADCLCSECDNGVRSADIPEPNGCVIIDGRGIDDTANGTSEIHIDREQSDTISTGTV